MLPFEWKGQSKIMLIKNSDKVGKISYLPVSSCQQYMSLWSWNENKSIRLWSKRLSKFMINIFDSNITEFRQQIVLCINGTCVLTFFGLLSM